MVIFPLAPDQTIAQMWSNGARGGMYMAYRDNNSWSEEKIYLTVWTYEAQRKC